MTTPGATGGPAAVNDAVTKLVEADRNLAMVERRFAVKKGKLTSYSQYAHSVSIGATEVCVTFTNKRGPKAFTVASVVPSDSVDEALGLITGGSYELWFSAKGGAILSFESKQDAVLFKIGFQGDRE